MNESPLRERTKKLALRIIPVVGVLPSGVVGQVFGNQLLRSGTSVGANYRAAMRAKSRADMINKLKIAEEEADETLNWLELLVDGNILPEANLKPLMNEVDEIVSMIVSSIRTLRGDGRS